MRHNIYRNRPLLMAVALAVTFGLEPVSVVWKPLAWKQSLAWAQSADPAHAPAGPPVVKSVTGQTKAAVDTKPMLPTTGGTSKTDAVSDQAVVLDAKSALPASLSCSLWSNSLLTVDAMVNGSMRRCAIDTGLSACVMMAEASQNLKVEPLSSHITVSALNDAASASEGVLKNLQFNLMKLDSLRVAVTDVNQLYPGASLPDAPEIWLGMPFVSAFQVTFDYPSRMVMLNKREVPLPKGKGAVVLPIQMRNGRIYTRVSVANAPAFWALVDTGAIGTLIPAKIATKLNLPAVKTYAIKRADGTAARATMVMLPKLSVGKIEEEQIPALYLETLASTPVLTSKTNGEKSGATKTNGAETNTHKPQNEKPAGQMSSTSKAGAQSNDDLAVLGADFLSHYRVTIDCAKLKMVLIPPTPPATDKGDVADTDKDKKKPAPANTTVGRPGANGGTVIKARPGGV